MRILINRSGGRGDLLSTIISPYTQRSIVYGHYVSMKVHLQVCLCFLYVYNIWRLNERSRKEVYFQSGGAIGIPDAKTSSATEPVCRLLEQL